MSDYSNANWAPEPMDDPKDATITRLHAEAAELRAELDMERNANAKVELALYDAKAEVERVRGLIKDARAQIGRVVDDHPSMCATYPEGGSNEPH